MGKSCSSCSSSWPRLPAQSPRLRIRRSTTPPQPRFDTRADLVLVDVSVVDGDSRPVQGLVATDFELKVNGQPRAIQNVQYIATLGTKSTTDTNPRETQYSQQRCPFERAIAALRRRREPPACQRLARRAAHRGASARTHRARRPRGPCAPARRQRRRRVHNRSQPRAPGARTRHRQAAGAHDEPTAPERRLGVREQRPLYLGAGARARMPGANRTGSRSPARSRRRTRPKWSSPRPPPAACSRSAFSKAS